MKVLALLGFTAVVMHAQNLFNVAPSNHVTIANVAETSHETRVRHIWLASIAAMAAGTAADAATSWHKHESNSILASSNGTFGAKGVAVKASIASAVLIPQVIFRHHTDWHSAFAISNFLEAGVFTGAAIHNVEVK